MESTSVRTTRIEGILVLLFCTIATLGALYVAGTPFTAWIDGMIG